MKKNFQDAGGISDLDLQHKTRELYTLRHRIIRYKRRLLKEGFRQAREKDVSFVLPEYAWPPLEQDPSKRYLHKDLEDDVDITPILNLAKEILPSLYNRYNSLMEKYEIGCDNLESMLNTLRNHSS
ncbi:hypothetical protein KY332_01750 [Candidatus Woesearchaeota archaeon]|nr:hypothetical protein [Candidatus Woesearchaeota archaeon]